MSSCFLIVWKSFSFHKLSFLFFSIVRQRLSIVYTYLIFMSSVAFNMFWIKTMKIFCVISTLNFYFTILAISIKEETRKNSSIWFSKYKNSFQFFPYLSFNYNLELSKKCNIVEKKIIKKWKLHIFFSTALKTLLFCSDLTYIIYVGCDSLFKNDKSTFKPCMVTFFIL